MPLKRILDAEVTPSITAAAKKYVTLIGKIQLVRNFHSRPTEKNTLALLNSIITHRGEPSDHGVTITVFLFSASSTLLLKFW